jgi:hypothetical protein
MVSDIDYLQAQAENAAYLVSRGVRAVSLLDASADEKMLPDVLAFLERYSQNSAIPFALKSGRRVLVGYASTPWAVELLRWAAESAPSSRWHEIVGLLLGYSADAIQRFRTEWDNRDRDD